MRLGAWTCPNVRLFSRSYAATTVPAPPQFPAGTEGSVLLVEEYDALGAAITAALKKFAPRHAVQVVRTLAAAREIAFKTPPDLLIVDFDPPLAGALDFLGQLRSAAPETRVIIIAAGIPREISREGRLPTALTFIEKPFQLEEFGAAIRHSLSRADAKTTGSVQGTTLDELNLADIIPLLGMEGVTEVVNVSISEQDLAGEIHFARGHIHHAAASGLEGIDALREMLRWTAPDFSRAESDAEAPRSIAGRWPKVLDEVLRSMPRSQSAPAPKIRRRAAPKEKALEKPKPPIVKDGKKVLVIDDTETLRDFVQEMLGTADPRLQIVCAPDATEGLRACLADRPDLILLDYSLPDFNGDEVCRRLLAHERTSRIPIIMMSGHVAEMADTAALYENVVLTLSKPFVSAALVAAVAQTLAKPPERKPRRSKPPIAEPAQKPNGREPARAQRAEAAPSPPTTVEPAPIASTPPPASTLTPAHIPIASSDAVVLNITLEVISMRFSPALHVSAIRARPSSPTVLLHVDPRAVSAVRLPEVVFEIAQVELDARGQLENVRLVPTSRRPEALWPHAGITVERLTVADASSGIQLTPASTAHLTIQLLAAFDLAGVELSPNFGVAHLVLRARGGRVRAILPGQDSKIGISFEAAQVLLDPSAHIAEISLDSAVA